MVGVVRDITERKRSEEELRQKNLSLTTLNDLEREFADLSSSTRVEDLVIKALCIVRSSS